MKLATLVVIAFFAVIALSAVIALAVLEEADADDLWTDPEEDQ